MCLKCVFAIGLFSTGLSLYLSCICRASSGEAHGEQNRVIVWVNVVFAVYPQCNSHSSNSKSTLVAKPIQAHTKPRDVLMLCSRCNSLSQCSFCDVFVMSLQCSMGAFGCGNAIPVVHPSRRQWRPRRAKQRQVKVSFYVLQHGLLALMEFNGQCFDTIYATGCWNTVLATQQLRIFVTAKEALIVKIIFVAYPSCTWPLGSQCTRNQAKPARHRPANLRKDR